MYVSVSAKVTSREMEIIYVGEFEIVSTKM
jgi:hypothetical protein